MLPDWPTTSPQAAGLPVEALDAAAQQLPFTFPDVTSLLVARSGQLAFEQYFSIAPDEEQDTQSVTKSLVSLLTGQLLERGLVRPSQPLLSLLPEMADAVTDTRWRAVTLEHLLGMTSGLPSELTDPAYDDAWFLSADPVRFSLGQPLVAAPGEVFHYSNAGVHLLGAALAKAAGQPLETLLHRHLLTPLGLNLGHWPRDRAGRVWASGGLHLSPRGLLRVGQLVLQGGHWQGRQAGKRRVARSVHLPKNQDRGLQLYGRAAGIRLAVVELRARRKRRTLRDGVWRPVPRCFSGVRLGDGDDRASRPSPEPPLSHPRSGRAGQLEGLKHDLQRV